MARVKLTLSRESSLSDSIIRGTLSAFLARRLCLPFCTVQTEQRKRVGRLLPYPPHMVTHSTLDLLLLEAEGSLLPLCDTSIQQEEEDKWPHM